MNEIINALEKLRILPVIALDDSKDAIPVMQALIDGGLPCAEITFRTDAAEDSIRIIGREFPNVVLGAGTVMTIEQVEKAIEAGASFIVTPGLNEPVVDYCISRDVTVFPGCMDTYAIEKAIARGLEIVKFFPAEPMGGMKMINALAGPYNKLKFMPTGGINPSNLSEYMKSDKIFSVGGSWMVKKALINERRFDEISSLAHEAVEIRDKAGDHDGK